MLVLNFSKVIEYLANVPKATMEGTLNLVRQAASANVMRVVVTSSVITTQGKRKHEFLCDDIVLTETDWNPATIETASEVVKSQNLFEVYGTAKTVAERELWKFADAHPEIDITTSEHCSLRLFSLRIFFTLSARIFQSILRISMGLSQPERRFAKAISKRSPQWLTSTKTYCLLMDPRLRLIATSKRIYL